MKKWVCFFASFVFFSCPFFAAINGLAAGQDESLVVWYNFDESDGQTVSDLSGHQNDATLAGGADRVKGKNGSAVQFNGTDAYLDCGNNESLRVTADFTISFWVKVDVPQPAPYATMVSWIKDTGGWAIYYGMPSFPGEYAHFLVGSTFPGLGGSMGPVLDDGNWHHVCFTYRQNRDGGSYVDGIRRFGRKMPAPVLMHDGRLLLGRHGADTGSKYYFKGMIDEFRLYNRILTTAEVREEYEASVAGITSAEDLALRNSIRMFPVSMDYSLLQSGDNKLSVRYAIPSESLARCGNLDLSLENVDGVNILRKILPVQGSGFCPLNLKVPAIEPGAYTLVSRILLTDGRAIKEFRQNVAVCSRFLTGEGAASVRKGDVFILDDFSRFAPAVSSGIADNSWYCEKYNFSGSNVQRQYLTAAGAAPVIRYKPPLKGWYAIYAGLVTPGKGINVSLEKEGEKFVAVAPSFHAKEGTAVVEEKFFRCSQLTGEEVLSLKSSFILKPSRLAYVKFVCLTDRQIDLVSGKKDISNGKKYIRYNDGNGLFWGKELSNGVEVIRNSVSRIKKESDIFDILDWCVGGGFMNYDTKVGTVLGDNEVIGSSPSGHEWMAKNLRNLIAAGNDPLKIVVEEAHKNGIKISGNLRMDTYYSPPNENLFNSRFWKEHPEFRLTFWTSRGPETFLDYYHPQVREERFQILKEVASRYDLDIIEFDFLRYAPFFGIAAADSFQQKYGRPPDLSGDDWEWYRYRAGFMTELVRKVRRMLDEEGKKKNKRIELWALVPGENFLRFGLDCETWVKEGLLDAVAAGTERQTNAASDISIDKFVRMVKGTACKVYARVDLNFGDDPTLEETPDNWVGFSSPPEDTTKNIFLTFFKQGADGIYLYNDILNVKPNLFLNLERWSEFEDSARSLVTAIEEQRQP